MKIEFDNELRDMEDALEDVEGDDLDAFQEEQRQKRLAEARRKRNVKMGIGAILAFGIIAVILNQDEASENLPEDLSAEWSHVAPFLEVHALDGGLIAVLPSRWDGDAEEACESMAAEAGLKEGRTITLLDAEGLVAAECEG